MSRIGKKSIELPDKVKLNIDQEGRVNVEGPKGKLAWTLPKQIKGRSQDKKVLFERNSEARNVRALHGLSRALVANMVTGVSAGFTKDLEIQGVGFKAAVQGKMLNLSLGFSHPVLFPIPESIKITVADNTKIKIEGIDKQIVGQAAADIRGYYPPEPYKGKGVRYAGEHVGARKARLFSKPWQNDPQPRCAIRAFAKASPARPSARGSRVHFSGNNIYAQVIDDTKARLSLRRTRPRRISARRRATRANTATAVKVGQARRRTRQGKEHRARSSSIAAASFITAK